MAEEKFSAEVEKKISEAGSAQEVSDIIAAQPRDEKGKFVAADAVKKEAAVVVDAEKKDEPVVYKDSFLIGGKEMEFTGESPADIQKQVKVALQAVEMAKAPEKKEEVKAGPTKEELAALQLKAASGDAEAMGEYIVKSGTLDRYLESKGVNLTQVKQVLETTAEQGVAAKWNTAVDGFLKNSDWPGGTQNEKLLKYRLAELKDDAGQPLAYNPSEESLMRAYDSLKADEMLFPNPDVQRVEAKKEEVKAEPVKVEPAKKKDSGSTLFGSTGGQTARKTETKAEAPKITDDMTPDQIIAAYKETLIASGQSPDDAFRQAYSGRA